MGPYKERAHTHLVLASAHAKATLGLDLSIQRPIVSKQVAYSITAIDVKMQVINVDNKRSRSQPEMDWGHTIGH